MGEVGGVTGDSCHDGSRRRSAGGLGGVVGGLVCGLLVKRHTCVGEGGQRISYAHTAHTACTSACTARHWARRGGGRYRHEGRGGR